ncbi:hypothetical protein [Streptomyces sp. NPDC021096]|uniref:hypothetical protein n=1 Tax=Streptomyces sp. NPDC021096 TaxID=3154792 RepID=UPI003407BED3
MNRSRAVAMALLTSVILSSGACSEQQKTSAPDDATKALQNMVSRDPVTVRNSLSRRLADKASPSSLVAPAGARLDVQADSWKQKGDDAQLRAVVTMPQQDPVTTVFYLVREEGQWRVLFGEAG